MIDLLGYAAAVVALVAAGSRVWATRGFARRSEIWTLCVGGGLLALAALLLAPSTTSVLASVEARTGVDAVKLLGDALRMAGAGAAGLLATRIRDDRAPSSRTWLHGLLVVEVLLVGCFLAAGFHASGDGAIRAQPGFGSVYDSIRLVYPIVALGLFVVAVWPYARGLPRGPARAGSRILLFAAVVGIAWTSWTVDDIVQLAGTGRQNSGDDVPSVVLEVVFVVAAAAGMTVTVWDRLVQAARTWWQAVRSYRAMGPLWCALCAPEGVAGGVRPGVVPGAPAGLAERLAVRPWRASIARYRRVIEIRDAQLALRPYHPGGTGTVGWTPSDEAAAIVAGLRAFAAGDPCDVPRRVGDAPPALPVGSGSAVSIEAEAQWLVEVTRAFVAARRAVPAAT